MPKILFFDKGGRKERLKLINQKLAPKDFFQGLNTLQDKGYNIKHLSSSKPYKKNIIFYIGSLVEKIFCKLTNIGIRPLSVFQFKEFINSSSHVISLTDGFSLSLGFYYSFFDKQNKIKLAGGFHRLSEYDKKLPKILKSFYYQIFRMILNRLNILVFYGESDRLNSIKHFNLDEEKTFLIKFGVDTDFWCKGDIKTFNSGYLFSIGQDPSRDFKTLLKVKTEKKIHIHTSLLAPLDEKHFKITNGSYHKYKSSFTDIEIRKLYQDAFAVIVPLKDVFQPSGYSVTLQSMACGKVVILTKTKGLWAPIIFKNKINCILVKPKSKNEIEEAIKFLQNNKSIYEKISNNARKTVEEYFSLKNSTESTLELFKKFI